MPEDNSSTNVNFNDSRDSSSPDSATSETDVPRETNSPREPDEIRETPKVPEFVEIDLAAFSTPDLKKLFEAGAHFGHAPARWNPKMRDFIHSKRDGIHIINLEKTIDQLNKAREFLSDVAKSRQVLFVGTKKQLRDITRATAETVDQPFVAERWLGGMLTNSATVISQIKKLKNLEKRMSTGELANRYSKLEVQRFQEEIDSLNQRYGGIKELHSRPGAIIVLDAVGDKNAIAEAAKLGVPIVAICDTNADPSQIDFPIPANDDAIASVKLIANYLASAVQSGLAKADKRPSHER